MALLTTLEQLESVQAAIQVIEAGAQYYSLSERAVRKPELDRLYERERELLARYAKEQSLGGSRTRADFQDPQ